MRFDSSVWTGTRDALGKLFYGKCAFCESTLSSHSFGDVVHYRPRTPVRLEDGSLLDPGYWWLAYEWRNLYHSCERCNATKIDFFPLTNEGNRAYGPEADLSLEDPLLLDPCDDDDARDPARHLLFRKDGTAEARPDPTNEGEPSVYGQKSIELYGLNREHLLKARREAMEETLGIVPGIVGGSREHREDLEKYFQPNLEFAQARRQRVVLEILRKLPGLSLEEQSGSIVFLLEVLLKACTPREVHALWHAWDGVLTSATLDARRKAGEAIHLPLEPDLEFILGRGLEGDPPPPSMDDEALSASPREELGTAKGFEPTAEMEPLDEKASDYGDLGPTLGGESRAGKSRGGKRRPYEYPEVEFGGSFSKSAEPELPRTESKQPKIQFSPTPQLQDDLKRARSRARLKKITIHNFRAIREFQIEMEPVSFSDSLPWLVILGENATGKSSILEAVALALMGHRLDNFVAKHDLRWDRLLTKGKTEGSIIVEFSQGGDNQTRHLKFNDQGASFVGDDQPVDFLVRGYGGTRLGPERGSDHKFSKRVAFQADNLFDPRAALEDVDSFFSSLDGANESWSKSFSERTKTTFDLFANAVWDILRSARPKRERSDSEESSGNHLYIEDDEMRVMLDDQDFVFRELSTGFQSAVALVGDILAGAPDVDIYPAELAGMVMLDEIGAHLHPRWRQRIVRDLRDTFPNIQFIVTTHEPLCLQGVDEKDRLVLMRAEKPRIKVFDREHDPSPAGMRADQLLNSRYFGLYSTLDNETDQLFREYYRLLANEPNLQEDEKKQLATLKDKVNDLGSSYLRLGSTRREQLLFEILDKKLAAEEWGEDEEWKPMTKPSEEVKREVWKLWTAKRDTK